MLRPLLKTSVEILLVGSIVLGLNSCTQDYFKLENLKEDPFTWEPDLAFPLVFSKLTASDIITNVDTSNIYQVDADNFVTLIYRSVIFSQTINEYFSIPNPLPFQDNENLDGPQVSDFNGAGTVQSNYSGLHPFGLIAPSGAALEEFVFQTGSISVTTNGSMGHAGNVVATFPDLTLNGIPLSMNIALDVNQNGFGSSDITGYALDLDNNGPNSLLVNYQLTVTNSGGAAPTVADAFTVDIAFENSTMQSATGDFGQFDIGINPSNVDVDILDNQQAGEITFTDPRLKITIENSIGADIAGTINALRAEESGGNSINVDYAGVTSQNFIVPSAPALGNASVVEWYFTGTNNVTPGANSNIDVVINENYEDLHYNLSALANPGLGPFSNFADQSSAVEVTADVELPFWGTAENFTIRDTIDFPIGDAEEFRDNIIEALLRVNTLNGFPVDGNLVLHFTDSLYNITESILNNGEQLVRSGTIDGAGRVVSPSNENNDIILDESRINNVFGAKYIILDAIMNSTNAGQTPIRLYDDYELTVSLGFQIKLSAGLSDLDGL